MDAAALSVVRRKAPSTIPTAAIATTAKNFIFGDVADLTNIQLETTTTCCVIERKTRNHTNVQIRWHWGQQRCPVIANNETNFVPVLLTIIYFLSSGHKQLEIGLV